MILRSFWKPRENKHAIPDSLQICRSHIPNMYTAFATPLLRNNTEKNLRIESLGLKNALIMLPFIIFQVQHFHWWLSTI